MIAQAAGGCVGDVESYLEDFHGRYPGVSSVVFAGVTQDGRSSYQRVVDALELQPGHTAIDVACGDGFLLECMGRSARDVRRSGVDLSAAELEAARQRLGSDVELHQGRAQALPFASASADRVSCHMALFLMDDGDQVAAELARVLRPGGRLAATVAGEANTDATYRLFWDEADRLARQEEFSFGGFGDERWGSAEGRRAIFSAQLGWGVLREEPLQLVVSVPRAQIWDFFRKAFYAIDQLPERARTGLRAFVESSEALAPKGMMTWTFNVRLMTVERL
jgi:SAM-dependent methyltransferase